jgi:hypothetical protein
VEVMARVDTNEITEMWRAARREQQDRRHARLPVRTAEIEALRANGYTVQRLTDYQFRINGRLDLFPIHRRWHDIKANRRGSYVSALAIVKRKLAEGGR